MIKRVFGWFFSVLLAAILFLFVLPAILIGLVVAVSGQFAGESAHGDKAVAVIELTSQIIDTSETVKQLYKQVENEKVKGIVLRIDSPGGGVGASQDVYSAVRALKSKKPIVASLGGVAASGGLYAALGATKIYTQPGTISGSIGVIAQFPNFHSVADKVGVQMVTVKSGKLKDAGNPFREMTPEDQAFLQQVIDTAYLDFIGAVSESRNIPLEKVREFADGRIILGRQAKELGLVDEFGGLYDAARGVMELAGSPLPEGEYPKLFYPADKFGSLKDLVESATRSVNIASRGVSIEYR